MLVMILKLQKFMKMIIIWLQKVHDQFLKEFFSFLLLGINEHFWISLLSFPN
jgi:hypothetical protein